MTVSRALRRLLRIRELEEEQSRLALEAASGDLHNLQHAQAATLERDRRGRRLVLASAMNGEFQDRLSGLEETRAAGRAALVLRPRIANAEQQVAGLREDFLARRVERRQAETLIEEGEARDALDADRRSQQALDDWFRNRRHTADAQARPAEPVNSCQPEFPMTSTPEGAFKSFVD
jgi:flagellar biosynthesis chaperone FliJ